MRNEKIQNKRKPLVTSIVLSLIVLLLIAMGIYLWHIRYEFKKTDVEIALCKPGNLWSIYEPNSWNDSVFHQVEDYCHFDEDSVTYANTFLDYMSKNKICKEPWSFKRSSRKLIMPRNGLQICEYININYGMKFKVVRVDHDTIYLTRINNERIIMINWTDSDSEKFQSDHTIKTEWKPLPRIEVTNKMYDDY